ncbi:TatA/E family twin arginine-targeting protein translocase [uncultured Prochlorococcus sp.]|uniref:TatA/E family twin arginine-targeting protein translocase n=1 Tax=uncultured Prochlorococcus sp. TaxID=159733 RepID=UPI0025905F00|nr:TatA/E family twin arginine-targeting protein translocase [uncultured Prochlorococcus sp.]
MNIFGVGLPEVTVILILALLIFGPKKLPELGKQLGKTLKSLKKASNEFQNEIDQVMNEEDKEESPKLIESNQKNEINQEKLDSENKNLSNKGKSNN